MRPWRVYQSIVETGQPTSSAASGQVSHSVTTACAENDLDPATDILDVGGVAVLGSVENQLTFPLDSQQPREAPKVDAAGLDVCYPHTAKVRVGMPSRARDLADARLVALDVGSDD